MVKEKAKVKQRGRAGRRAWGFEERLESRRGSDVARICLEELKERVRKGKDLSKWEKERKNFFKGREMGIREVEERRNEENNWFEELEKRHNQKRERWLK